LCVMLVVSCATLGAASNPPQMLTDSSDTRTLLLKGPRVTMTTSRRILETNPQSAWEVGAPACDDLSIIPTRSRWVARR
jgi:hypothetical protein